MISKGKGKKTPLICDKKLSKQHLETSTTTTMVETMTNNNNNYINKRKELNVDRAFFFFFSSPLLLRAVFPSSGSRARIEKKKSIYAQLVNYTLFSFSPRVLLVSQYVTLSALFCSFPLLPFFFFSPSGLISRLGC